MLTGRKQFQPPGGGGRGWKGRKGRRLEKKKIKQTEEGGGKQREKVTLGVSTRGCSNRTLEANLFFIEVLQESSATSSPVGSRSDPLGPDQQHRATISSRDNSPELRTRHTAAPGGR